MCMIRRIYHCQVLLKYCENLTRFAANLELRIQPFSGVLHKEVGLSCFVLFSHCSASSWKRSNPRMYTKELDSVFSITVAIVFIGGKLVAETSITAFTIAVLRFLPCQLAAVNDLQKNPNEKALKLVGAEII
uniref:Uncharacterized protein n=1 Tax=Glossina austeni TaxID=7395 RepID=A0A1A9USN4_GLOAU